MTTQTLEKQNIFAEFTAQNATDCLNPFWEYVEEDLDYIWDTSISTSEPISKNERYAYCEMINPACMGIPGLEEF